MTLSSAYSLFFSILYIFSKIYKIYIYSSMYLSIAGLRVLLFLIHDFLHEFSPSFIIKFEVTFLPVTRAFALKPGVSFPSLPSFPPSLPSFPPPSFPSVFPSLHSFPPSLPPFPPSLPLCPVSLLPPSPATPPPPQRHPVSTYSFSRHVSAVKT